MGKVVMKFDTLFMIQFISTTPKVIVIIAIKEMRDESR